MIYEPKKYYILCEKIPLLSGYEIVATSAGKEVLEVEIVDTHTNQTKIKYKTGECYKNPSLFGGGYIEETETCWIDSDRIKEYLTLKEVSVEINKINELVAKESSYVRDVHAYLEATYRGQIEEINKVVNKLLLRVVYLENNQNKTKRNKRGKK